jgi:hypothetical protein
MPQYLDEKGNPISPVKTDDKPVYLNEQGEVETGLWDRIFTAPKFITDPAERFATAITDPNLVSRVHKRLSSMFPGAGSLAGEGPLYRPVVPEGETAKTLGFLGGGTVGAAEQFSPGNIAFAVSGLGEAALIRQATKLASIGKLPQARRLLNIARGLEVPTRVASIPIVGEGGRALLSPESTLAERAMGTAQLAGGILGMRSRAHPALRALEERPTRLAPEAGDIPLTEEGGVFSVGEQRIRPDIIRPEDPRITSLVERDIPSVVPQEFGTVGPEVTGFQTGIEREVTPEINPAEAIAKIEAAREAARKGVDTEISSSINKITVKRDIPETTSRLIDQGWKIIGSTEEGYPILQREMTEEERFVSQFEDPGAIQLLEPEEGLGINASLESAASQEAISRQMGMQERGEQFVVYDRAGNKRPLIGPDAVDYIPRAGETYGIEGPSGFRMLEDKGGRVPFQPEIVEEPQFSRITDESGQPIDVRDWTPEELEQRKLDIRRDWAIARSEARSLGVDDRKFRSISELKEAIRVAKEEIEPKPARTETGEVITGINKDTVIQIIKNLYEKDVPIVATKELVQNSLDAVRHLGSQGRIDVKIDRNNNSIVVTDNGTGMTEAVFNKAYTDIGESGKKGQFDIGSYGIAKAAFQLGGTRFSVSTTADYPDGTRKTLTYSATPHELLNGLVRPNIVEAEELPTGTQVVVQFPSDSYVYGMSEFMNNLGKFAQTNAEIIFDNGFGGIPKKIESSTLNIGKPIAEVKTDAANGKIYIPRGVPNVTASEITVHISNKGMYQGTYSVHSFIEVPNVPQEIVVDISSNVGALDSSYPFVPSRERLKGPFAQEVSKWIDENIFQPSKNRRKEEIQKLYNSSTDAPFDHGTKRRFLFLDPTGQITPSESAKLIANPIMNEISWVFSNLTENILDVMSTKFPHWGVQLDGIGFVFAPPGFYGVHIPNPEKNMGSIFINPFAHFVESDGVTLRDPKKAVTNLVHTIAHEIAHSRLTEGGSLTPHENPKFEATLGDIYEQLAFGRREYEDQLLEVISDRSGTGYNTEVQKLLQFYQDAARRIGTKKDLLTGTGIRSDATGGKSEEVPQYSRADGERTTHGINRIELKDEKFSEKEKRQLREKLVEEGFFATGVSSPKGHPIWERAEVIPGPIELSKRVLRGSTNWREAARLTAREIWNLSRGLRAVDPPFVTSAMFRQARPMIGVNLSGWLKAWRSQASAYGDKVAYQQIIEEISKDPLFQRRLDESGKELPSWAEEWGLQMPVLGKTTGREEMIVSNWAEMIPGWGAHVRGSNRSFTAALATSRASALKNFIDLAQIQTRSVLGFKIPVRDPFIDIEFGKEIAEAINVLNGKGKLKLDIPGSRSGVSVEGAAGVLSNIFFSPRYQAAIIKMLNPATYMNADPMIRKIYLKGLFSLIISWWTLNSLLQAIGFEVNLDPNSADFGKAKLGNYRLDLGSGIQQYIVLFSRMRPEWFAAPSAVPTPFGEFEDPGGGKFTSSGTGRTEILGESGAPTRGELLLGPRGFIPNKFHPSFRLAWDILYANRSRPVFLGDRAIQLVAPMMLDDLVEISQEEPMLIPFAATASGIGFGSQFYEGGAAEKPIYTPVIEELTGIPVTEFDIQFGGR